MEELELMVILILLVDVFVDKVVAWVVQVSVDADSPCQTTATLQVVPEATAERWHLAKVVAPVFTEPNSP